MSDQLDAENSIRQQTTIITDRHPCAGGIRTRNPNKQATADSRLRTLGHWERHRVSVRPDGLD